MCWDQIPFPLHADVKLNLLSLSAVSNTTPMGHPKRKAGDLNARLDNAPAPSQGQLRHRAGLDQAALRQPRPYSQRTKGPATDREQNDGIIRDARSKRSAESPQEQLWAAG